MNGPRSRSSLNARVKFSKPTVTRHPGEIVEPSSAWN